MPLVAAAVISAALAACAQGAPRRPGNGIDLDAATGRDGGSGPRPRLDAGTMRDAGESTGRDAGRRPDAGRHDSGSTEDGGSLPDAGPDDAGVDDAGGPSSDGGDPGAACAQALAAATFDFETGAEGWTHRRMDGVTGMWPFDPWEVGAAEHGPAGCASGTQCWGTDLDDNYVQCQRAELVSPPIDLSACTGETVVLVFEHWYDLWTGEWDGSQWYDGGLVELSRDGTSWSAPSGVEFPGTIAINPRQTASFRCVEENGFYVHGLGGYVMASPGWQTEEITLSPADLESPVYIRFAYASGVSYQSTDPEVSRNHTRPGWYVDHVRFEMR